MKLVIGLFLMVFGLFKAKTVEKYWKTIYIPPENWLTTKVVEHVYNEDMCMIECLKEDQNCRGYHLEGSANLCKLGVATEDSNPNIVNRIRVKAEAGFIQDAPSTTTAITTTTTTTTTTTSTSTSTTTTTTAAVTTTTTTTNPPVEGRFAVLGSEANVNIDIDLPIGGGIQVTDDPTWLPKWPNHDFERHPLGVYFAQESRFVLCGDKSALCSSFTLGDSNWVSAPSVTDVRKFCAFVQVLVSGQTNLWLLGGRKVGGTNIRDTTLLFDGTSWSPGPVMPMELIKFYAVNIGIGRVFVFGNNMWETYIYDFATTLWTQKADVISFRRDVATAHIKFPNGTSLVLAVSGRSATTYTDRVDVYDINGNNWYILGTSFGGGAIIHHYGIVVAGRFLIAGGIFENGSPMRGLWEFNPDNGDWTEVIADLGHDIDGPVMLQYDIV